MLRIILAVICALNEAAQIPTEVVIVYQFAKGLGLIAAALGVPLWIWRQAKKVIEQNNEINRKQNNGVQVMLYFRLKRECKRVIEKGSMSMAEYEDIILLHDAYKQLGHNGIIDDIYNRALSMPCEE